MCSDYGLQVRKNLKSDKWDFCRLKAVTPPTPDAGLYRIRYRQASITQGYHETNEDSLLESHPKAGLTIDFGAYS